MYGQFIRGNGDLLNVIDPDEDGLTTEQEAIVPEGCGYSDRLFGYAVSVDGDRALIGHPGQSCAPGWEFGAAFVFVRSGTAWSQEDELWNRNRRLRWDMFGLAVSPSRLTARLCE